MAIVTGDRYLDYLVKFVDKQAGPLLDGSLVLKLNPVGLHYVQSRLEALQELESLLAGAPVDYLRAYISDLGDHRALEQLRRILRLLTSLKVVSVLPPPARDPTPLPLLPFGRLKFLELRGCDLSTSSARGLLELRNTLEKIIVHNSTDALRHVFASRIADIKDSPAWSRLLLVSCPCNGLVLMDESLQLLPSVETLDLSRNRFAKVDNLRKCTKLKHLDLGFNHLRSISSLSEVAGSIVKLVLRNNALTSLHGIETFKLIEGLDLSYNVISNISELEILSGLPSLQNLWLEGNPICCIPWFRAQVFSFFSHPEKLKLDEKEITTRESWKRQIVLASRLKKPAGFGFYCPAKDNDEEDGSVNRNRKKLSRLAPIEEEEEQASCIFPEAIDHDSVSCESEIRSREEAGVSDNEAEIVDLMNRVEFMKKEHSVLWVREFQEWMDQNSENLVDNTKLLGSVGPGKENSIESREGHMQHGESSKYVSDMVSASGEGSTTNLLESDNSFGDGFVGLHGYQYFNTDNEVALESSIVECGGDSGPDMRTGDISVEPEQPNVPFQAQFSSLPLAKGSRLSDTSKPHTNVKADVVDTLIPTIAIDEMMDSHLSSVYTGSPPHYEEDILQRRNNLEEEFMQLSVQSCSLASSDSDTSTSDDAFCSFDTYSPEDDRFLYEESGNWILVDHSELHFPEDISCGRRGETSNRQDGRPSFDSCTDQTSGVKELLKADHMDNKLTDSDVCDIDNADEQDDEGLEKMKRKRRLRRRVVSLLEENNTVSNTKPLSLKQNGSAKVTGEMEDRSVGKNLGRSDFQMFYANNHMTSNGTAHSQSMPDEVIKNYFHANIADSSVPETCLRCMLCNCMLQRESEMKESEVVILLSSANKVYVLLVNTTSDGSGVVSEVVGCHRLDEIKEVVVGIGLQVLRVYIEMGANYLFITKSLERSRELLSLLGICDSTALSNRYSLLSAENVQAELFEKDVCRDSNVSIFLYSMLLFWCNSNEEESWLSRSLFVIEGYVIVCVEDLVRFSFDTMDDASSAPYFSLDSCCSISDISEMVIEPRDSRCVTLTLDSEKLTPRINLENEKVLTHLKEKMVTGSNTWKLKWFSEDILLKFVALLKALHAETAMYPLTVKCIS